MFISTYKQIYLRLYEYTCVYVYIYAHMCFTYVYVPVVPHKAVAEISKIGNL